MLKNVLNRRLIFFYCKTAVSLLILWLLIHTAQLRFELLTALFEKPWHAAGLVGLLLFSVLTNAWRWHRLNRAQNICLPFSRSVMATYIGIAFNTVLPGSVGGDVVRCFYVVKRFPAQKSAAILSTFLDRFCGLMGIIVVASFIAAWHLDVLRSNHALFYIIKTCFAMTITSLLFFAIFFFLPKRMGLSRYFNKLTTIRWLRPVRSLLHALNVYRESKRILLEALMAGILNQLLLWVVVLLIGDMTAQPAVPAYVYMAALAIAQIANLIPLTPGGVGIGEAAFAKVVLLLAPGATGAYATIFFAFRLSLTLTYLPGVLWGMMGTNVLQEKKERPYAQADSDAIIANIE